MSNNKNYNRNRPNLNDNNNQRGSKLEGGEHRNGRLSQFKNSNTDEGDIPNEYLNENKD
jgi:hypothetical protein